MVVPSMKKKKKIDSRRATQDPEAYYDYGSHSNNQDQTYSSEEEEEEDVDTIIKRIEKEFIANRRTRKQPGQQKRSMAPRIQEAADALLRDQQLSNVHHSGSIGL